MTKFRKAFTVSLMMVTVLAMSVVVAPNANAAASAGDLIKMDGLSSVYYLGADGKRYVFPNEATYFSWYGDFSSVKTIPQSELESYPLGKNVTMRPGTKLVKITTNPKVYAVEPDGVLRPIPDEATALALYGENWNKKIVDVPDAFFTNYTISSEAVADDAYPEGTLVKFGESADVYYIGDDGKARKIADEAAFLANRFKWDDIITSSLTMPAAGADITGSEEGLVDTSSGAGGTAGAGTGLTVSIASDTPEAGNIPAGSPVDFLKLNFTASNDGDVTINAITLDAYDLGNSTYIDNVTFYDNGLKVGNSKNMTSDRVASFNFATPIKISAGTTKSLLVRATIQAGQSGNFAIGLATASKVVTNGAVVSGSFPLISNSKAIVTGTNIGEVDLPNTSVSEDSGATAEFGEDDILLAGFNLTVSNEPVIWESAMFKNGGTNDDAIVDNLRILVDGDVVAEGASMVDKYVQFDMGNYLIAKGDTVSVEVYGDAGIGNVKNTINLYIDEANDFSFVGQDFGFGILMDSTTDTNNDNIADKIDAAGEGILVTLSAGDVTIDMDKSAAPAQDVRPGTDSVVLANFSIVSNGENATIDSITDDGFNDFYISGTGLECAEIDNAKLKDVDSGIFYDLSVSSSTAGTAAKCGLTVSDEISLVKGVTKTYEVLVDVQGSTDTNTAEANDTYQVTLASTAFTITGDESDANLQSKISPSSVSGSVTTVKTASLKWSTTALTAKTVVTNAEDVIIYQASLKAGASSEVRLTSFRLDVDDTIWHGSLNDDNISNITAYLDGKEIWSKSNGITEDASFPKSDTYISFTSLNSANRVIKAGDTVDLVIKADFSSSFATSGAWALEMASADNITVRDVDNNTFAAEPESTTANSRQITLAETGTLKVELKTDDAKADVATYVVAGSETTQDRYLAELVFTTANEPVTVEDLALGRSPYADFTSSDVAYVKLYDEDGVEVGSAAPNANGNVLFEDWNYELPADQATSLFIGIETKGINVEGDAGSTATHGRNVALIMADATDLSDLDVTYGVVAKGANSGEVLNLTQAVTNDPIAGQYENATTTTATSTITGAAITAIAKNMDDGTLVNGIAKQIAKFTIVADNGANRVAVVNEALKAQLTELVLTVATSGASVSSVQAYLEGQSSTKTAAATSAYSAGATKFTLDLTGLPDSGLIDGQVNLIIIANITGGSTTGHFVDSIIANLGTDVSYDGNNGSATDFSDLRLDYTETGSINLSL